MAIALRFLGATGTVTGSRYLVRNLDQLSAHADAAQLVDWLAQFRAAPARIFLTHGEPAAANALRKRIAARLGWQAEVPEYLQAVKINGVRLHSS